MTKPKAMIDITMTTNEMPTTMMLSIKEQERRIHQATILIMIADERVTRIMLFINEQEKEIHTNINN